MAERLAALLAPELSLAERWRERAARAGVAADTSLDRYLGVAQSLVGHLDRGTPLECPESARITVNELAVLRQLGHEQILDGAAADDDLPALLSRLDGAIDTLLQDCVDNHVRNLEIDALIDPLTGARNRRALERDLRTAVALASRHHYPLSIVMIDLDGLKAVNDGEGHDAGDARLRDLAAAFTAQLREGDAIYRVGGDEFVAMLPYANAEAGALLVERVRPQSPPFTAGVATSPADGADPGALLAAADRRLLDQRSQRRSPGLGRGLEAIMAPDPGDRGPAFLSRDRPSSGGPALTVASVTTRLSSASTSIEVSIEQGPLTGVGRSTGAPAAHAEPRIAAAAALDALEQLGYELTAYVDHGEVRPAGHHDVVTVTISSRVGDFDLTIAGSAVVARSVAEAAARAVVQAMLPVLPSQIIRV